MFSVLERKISVRSTKEELIRKGYLKEPIEDAANGTEDLQTTTIHEEPCGEDIQETVTNHVDGEGRFMKGYV